MKTERKSRHQNSRRTRKTVITIVIVVVVLALAAYLGVAHSKNLWPWQPQNSPTVPPTSSTPDDGKDKPNNEQNSDKGNDNHSTDEIPVNNNANITISQLEQRNNFVNVSAIISSATDGGQCSFVFSNPNARPVTYTSKTAIKNSVLSCEASIPEDEFSYIGTWSLTLRYYFNDQQIVTNKDILIK